MRQEGTIQPPPERTMKEPGEQVKKVKEGEGPKRNRQPVPAFEGKTVNGLGSGEGAGSGRAPRKVAETEKTVQGKEAKSKMH